jgi:putative DNA primase/helicase
MRPAALFDQDPDVLNVLNGTIDLRSGKLRPHNPADHITRLVPVAFDPAATAPLWEQTLREVLPDPATRAFVQRALGYTVTGRVDEQCLFFAYGDGRNGKGVILGTVLRLLGPDYARPAPETLVIQTRNEQHSTELKALEGMRLIKVDETRQHGRLNEGRVKWLTGGDLIQARGMRQDFGRGFEPTFKIWISSNHRPTVVGTETAIWARIVEVPFTVYFCGPDDEEGKARGYKPQDHSLSDRLRAEYPGILKWLADGAREWYANGLQRPEPVRHATAEYRKEQDVFGSFLAAYPRPKSGKVRLKDVTASYNMHARASGGLQLQPSAVKKELERHGLHCATGAQNYTFVHFPELAA